MKQDQKKLSYYQIMKNYTQRLTRYKYNIMTYKNIIIVDTETTGLDNEDRIIQLALLVVNVETLEVEKTSCSLCKAPLPIKPGASAVNKKTNPRTPT